MSEPEDCKGVCAREAFEMPEGCPPVSKPNVIDVVACTLPELEPTDFEQHPLVVDMPVVPFNVACTCLDVQTNLVVKDDRHTSNKASFRQASGPGAQDCCMGLYALDLELNIPTCSSDPPNITGSGSRGITVSGKGIPRQDEPCMFDLDMNIDVPCPLSDISIGDGQGIAEIEKEEDPDNCKLSFDVKVPCPLPGITFTVTGQASGSIVTGGAGSIGADGNTSTVDSGGDGGGRIGGNTVFASSLAYARGASGGGGGASGASGGGGGGGGADCKLELRLNVPCQLPGVSFVVNGQASGGIKTAPSPSGSQEECKTDLEINVPCQLPNIKVLETIKPYSPTTQNPKISLKDAIRLLKATGASEECEASLQLEADDVTIPCEGLSLDITGPASGHVTDSSDDCDKTLSITVDCQLNDLSIDVSGQASGSIVHDTPSGKDCAKKITIEVPCQLDNLKFDTDIGEEEPVPAQSGGLVDTSKLVWYDPEKKGSCTATGGTITLHTRKFKVPVTTVTGGTGISVSHSTSDNSTTYTVGLSGSIKTRTVYIPTSLSFGISGSNLTVTITSTAVSVYSDATSTVGSASLSKSVSIGNCTS